MQSLLSTNSLSNLPFWYVVQSRKLVKRMLQEVLLGKQQREKENSMNSGSVAYARANQLNLSISEDLSYARCNPYHPDKTLAQTAIK